MPNNGFIDKMRGDRRKECDFPKARQFVHDDIFHKAKVISKSIQNKGQKLNPREKSLVN